MKRIRWRASGGRGLPVAGSIVSMIWRRVGWAVSFWLVDFLYHYQENKFKSVELIHFFMKFCNVVKINSDSFAFIHLYE